MVVMVVMIIMIIMMMVRMMIMIMIMRRMMIKIKTQAVESPDQTETVGDRREFYMEVTASDSALHSN